MLVLARKKNEAVVIGGLGGFESMIKVTVVRLGRDVKLGFEAATEIPIHRQEVWEQIRARAEVGDDGSTAKAPRALSAAGT